MGSDMRRHGIRFEWSARYEFARRQRRWIHIFSLDLQTWYPVQIMTHHLRHRVLQILY